MQQRARIASTRLAAPPAPARTARWSTPLRRPLPRPTWTAPTAAAAAEADVLAVADAAVAAARAPGGFAWSDAWYPVLCVQGASAADPTRPHAVQVLGADLVAWRDGASGEWRVADDACPHRLAPLSEGRLDVNPATGESELACSYHGWSFKGCGACAKIPQSAHDPAGLVTALASRRSALVMRPTVVAAGLLFAWGEGGAGAADRAAAAPPPPVPTEVVAQVEKSGWYVRDTPCAWRGGGGRGGKRWLWAVRADPRPPSPQTTIRSSSRT
jgi:pheophorbide a oxygenase/SWI/SNF-related matrix-associated actin-dependent regulator 1 of chromatin subfamily A